MHSGDFEYIYILEILNYNQKNILRNQIVKKITKIHFKETDKFNHKKSFQSYEIIQKNHTEF